MNTRTRGALPTLEEALPHAHPLILLDEIFHCSESTIECRVKVNPTKFPQYEALEKIPCWLGLEYMAQAIAAFVGVKRVQGGKKAVLGFFLGSRHIDFHVTEYFKGQNLVIAAERIWDDQSMGIFSCSIKDAKDDNVLAQGRLNVYQPKDRQELLERAGLIGKDSHEGQ